LKRFIAAFLLFSSLSAILFAKDYRSNPKTKAFIKMMAREYNFKPSYLSKLFSDVRVENISLSIYTHKRKRPSKRLKKLYPLHGSWDRYVKLKVTPLRVKDGKAFLKRYKTAFKKVEKIYGVPAEIIAAIIGIESLYGKNMGKAYVFDTLATLSFEKNRRERFFQKELADFLQLTYEYKIDPKKVKGSYAGAIGLGQFMPSNYKAYGVDFNNDGKVSMINPVDAIASIANYLKQNGWRRGEEIAVRAFYRGVRFRRLKTGYNRLYSQNRLKKLGIKPRRAWRYRGKVRLIKLDRAKYDELWFGAKNFYVITRYNHSAYYAMSVYQLAKRLKGAI
jgi:membrane-bound lytic murein transglycosylase B